MRCNNACLLRFGKVVPRLSESCRSQISRLNVLPSKFPATFHRVISSSVLYRNKASSGYENCLLHRMASWQCWARASRNGAPKCRSSRLLKIASRSQALIYFVPKGSARSISGCSYLQETQLRYYHQVLWSTSNSNNP